MKVIESFVVTFFMLTLCTYMLYLGDCVAYEVLAKGSQPKRGKFIVNSSRHVLRGRGVGWGCNRGERVEE